MLHMSVAIEVVLGLVLSGCGAMTETVPIKKNVTETVATLTDMSIKVQPTMTNNQVPTATPISEENLKPTSIATTFYDGYLSEIPMSTTQGPISIATNEPFDNKYIYKYAIVTFTTPWKEGNNFLNLDDLNNSTPENSDIAIEHSVGSGGTFMSLYPQNGSTYYYSDLHGMSYDTCLEHFPFTKMDPKIYSLQKFRIGSGRDYCVLTGEGRLSIIRLYPDSIYLSSDDGLFTYLEVVVTTYRKVVTQASTPYSTETLGPTPVPDRYAGMNLTQKQKKGLDRAAQIFIDAIASGDRKKVASLLEYPFAIDRGKKYYPDYANNEEEFLSVYGELFTPDIVKEISNATLEENMGIHSSDDISLLFPDCIISFYPDGKIGYISISSIWWKTEVSSHHVTQGDAQ